MVASCSTVRHSAQVFSGFTITVRASTATWSSVYVIPFCSQAGPSVGSSVLIGREASLMSVSPTQKRSKPPPVPEIPTVTVTSGFSAWNASAAAVGQRTDRRGAVGFDGARDLASGGLSGGTTRVCGRGRVGRRRASCACLVATTAAGRDDGKECGGQDDEEKRLRTGVEPCFSLPISVNRSECGPGRVARGAQFGEGLVKTW